MMWNLWLVRFVNQDIMLVYLMILLAMVLYILRTKRQSYAPPGYRPRLVRTRKVIFFLTLILAVALAGHPAVPAVEYGLSPATFLVIPAPGFEHAAAELTSLLGEERISNTPPGIRAHGADLCVYVTDGLTPPPSLPCGEERSIVLVVNGSILEAQARIPASVYLPWNSRDVLRDLRVESQVSGESSMIELNDLLMVMISSLLVVDYYLRREFDPTSTVRFKRVALSMLALPLPRLELIPLLAVALLSWVRVGTSGKQRSLMMRVTSETVWLKWEDDPRIFVWKILEEIIIFLAMLEYFPVELVFPMMILEVILPGF